MTIFHRALLCDTLSAQFYYAVYFHLTCAQQMGSSALVIGPVLVSNKCKSADPVLIMLCFVSPCFS